MRSRSDRSSARGVSPWTILGVLTAFLIAVAALAAYVRHSPFEAAMRAAQRSGEMIADPDLLQARGWLDKDPALIAAASVHSTEPGFAAAWVGEVEDGDPRAFATALDRWSELDPENPVPGLVRAGAILRDREPGALTRAAALIDATVGRPRASFHAGHTISSHLRLQARLGVRDGAALFAAARGSAPFGLARKAAFLERARAEKDLHDGRLREALERGAALRTLGERLAASSRTMIERLVAEAVGGLGAEVESQAAAGLGERATLEAVTAFRREGASLQSEVMAGLTLVTEISDLPSLSPPWAGRVGREVQRTVHAAMLRWRAEDLFAYWRDPGGELAYVRAAVKGLQLPPASPHPAPLDLFLLAPDAFRAPAGPGIAPPAELIAILNGEHEDLRLRGSVAERAVAPALARYGARALAALDAIPPAGRAPYVAAFAAAGHPSATALVREDPAMFLTEHPAGYAAAVIRLGDRVAFEAALASSGVFIEHDIEAWFALDAIHRAMTGKPLPEPARR